MNSAIFRALLAEVNIKYKIQKWVQYYKLNFTRMSYSIRLQCNRRWFRHEKKFSFGFFHTVTKFHKPSYTITRKRLPLCKGCQCPANSLLSSYRHRYSFVYSSKPYALNTPTLWLRNSSNGKQPPSLGSIENEDAPLTKSQANDLVLRLTEDERKALLTALHEYDSNQVKAEYEGQLAATRWRSKFGRPSKLPTLGDVDPTGSYCHLPEDWLKKKYAEKVPAPTGQQLINVAFFNAIPFVGFGFLDNFIMICAGDYIDETLGSLVTISTMAAAALGNTISDVMGIGSAWYVELAASKIGLKPPRLSPIQLDMKAARRAANLGRALGITVGCLLGMVPLLFFKKEDVKKKNKEI